MKAIYLILLVLLVSTQSSTAISFSSFKNFLFNNNKKLSSYFATNNLNQKPIIGILTQPSFFSGYSYANYSIINADNVIWLEASGAQVVPVEYGLPKEKLLEIFNSINGIFFGGADFNFYNNSYLFLGNDIYYSKYQESASYFIELAMQERDKGKFFPIWGTCSGFELIVDIIANPPHGNSLQYLDDNNRSENITIINQNMSYIFEGMNEDMIDYVENNASLFFYHNWGVTTEHFWNTPNLSDFFYLTSYSYNLNGTQFVASIEGQKYPIYGTQFHPEKSEANFNAYYNANHSPEAIEIAQFIGNKFVNLARQSFHQFPTPQKQNKLLIDEFSPIKVPGSYAQVYFFESQNNTILVS